VRVVASSTRDLTRMVQAGTFREDFLHRINTIRIVLPALRERVVDVPLLAAHFLAHFGEQFGQRALQLGADATSVLERYRWPGNVRELRNVMERAALLAQRRSWRWRPFRRRPSRWRRSPRRRSPRRRSPR
jgi:transcriptional regulator with PAS, ATPase and Fis domain